MRKTLSLSEAKMKLNRLVDLVEAKDDEILITKNGAPVAALIPSSLYEGWLETMEIQADPRFMREIKRGIASLKRKSKRYTFEEVFGEKI